MSWSSYRSYSQRWVVEFFNDDPTVAVFSKKQNRAVIRKNPNGRWVKRWSHGFLMPKALQLVKGEAKGSRHTWRIRNPPTGNILMEDIL